MNSQCYIVVFVDTAMYSKGLVRELYILLSAFVICIIPHIHYVVSKIYLGLCTDSRPKASFYQYLCMLSILIHLNVTFNWHVIFLSMSSQSLLLKSPAPTP